MIFILLWRFGFVNVVIFRCVVYFLTAVRDFVYNFGNFRQFSLNFGNFAMSML